MDGTRALRCSTRAHQFPQPILRHLLQFCYSFSLPSLPPLLLFLLYYLVNRSVDVVVNLVVCPYAEEQAIGEGFDDEITIHVDELE